MVDWERTINRSGKRSPAVPRISSRRSNVSSSRNRSRWSLLQRRCFLPMYSERKFSCEHLPRIHDSGSCSKLIFELSTSSSLCEPDGFELITIAPYGIMGIKVIATRSIVPTSSASREKCGSTNRAGQKANSRKERTPLNILRLDVLLADCILTSPAFRKTFHGLI